MTLRALRNAQVDVLKRVIARRHAEILEDTREDVLRAREETYGALAGPVTDMADQASADVLADSGYAEISRDVRDAKELEAALARIDAGTYGRCAQCGVEIDFERLRAYPAATRCTRCQVHHERTFAQPANRKL